MFEAICIDDTGRPNDIPLSLWVKKGEKYLVIGVYKMTRQPGIFGYEIEGKDLTRYPPYKYFAHIRFSPLIPLEEVSKKEKEINPEEVVFRI